MWKHQLQVRPSGDDCLLYDIGHYMQLCIQVAARCLETAVQGAKYNVDINLGNIKDQKFREENFAAAEKELAIAVKNRDQVLSILSGRK